MPSASQEQSTAIASGPLASTRLSTEVRFADERVEEIPTSVEIYQVGGRWYCQIRRGEETTRPMGPYSKRQAERVQDIRTSLLAKRGTATLFFEEARGMKGPGVQRPSDGAAKDRVV